VRTPGPGEVELRDHSGSLPARAHRRVIRR
jgi:hypothetical protein